MALGTDVQGTQAGVAGPGPVTVVCHGVRHESESPAPPAGAPGVRLSPPGRPPHGGDRAPTDRTSG